jgi:hypothetical protein
VDLGHRGGPLPVEPGVAILNIGVEVQVADAGDSSIAPGEGEIMLTVFMLYGVE